MPNKISLIAAISENRVIGRDNKLPWHIKADLTRFRKLTTGHPVIMGRKTYESIGSLLPGRTNIIVTRDSQYAVEGAVIAHSLLDAIEIAKKQDGNDEIFIIGGGQIFQESINIAHKLYLTVIHQNVEGDVYFPPYHHFKKVIQKIDGEEEGYSYTFLDLEQ